MNIASEFALYFRLGLHHILDPGAVDHLLYLTIMTIPFVWRDWRRVVVLVTGFTLGHSLTLALAALDVVRADSRVVEVLIPVTILITALVVLYRNRRRAVEPDTARLQATTYLLPLGFGLQSRR